MHHTFIGKLVALSVEKYYMTLTEKKLKIRRFHRTLRQKGSRLLPYPIQILFWLKSYYPYPKTIQECIVLHNQSRNSRNQCPELGGARCHKGHKIQSRHNSVPQRKLRSPKLKYEAQEISEVRGLFERKVLTHCS